MVLLHGGESSKRQYDLFAPLLGEGIRAISYDQRDVGDTVNGPEPYTMATLAEDCAGLIDALGCRRAHLVGASLGGAIAMNVALDHPGRVASLTLISAPPTVEEAPGGVAEKVMAMSPGERAKFMLDAVISPEGRRREPELVEQVQALLGAGGIGERRRDAIRTHDCVDRLHEIGAPTLVLNGTDDPLMPASTAESVAERIPGAVLELLEGGRHGLTLEQREVTAGLVRRFVLKHAFAGITVSGGSRSAGEKS
ncbi:alpha/beta fold hydrolase [Amycolatopsis sp. NBRC 101858]|uniref:alpha/beta fold hydrolase n=1 Tax=Amycolatopsis sp. NBRC 101858 TaxID=3032200 RepID=UPI00255792B6|nr:alpha/beta fold hydrolase [Amycolatopsis sp. NBRC 101858]